MKRYFIQIIIAGFLCFLMLNPALAQDEYNHPELEWRSFDTEHFSVHFHQGTERTARLVAKIAEDIYQPVTNLYKYYPSKKIHFIIKDTDDYSNGGAFFFDDKIEIWAQNLDYVMRGTKNWLRDVVTHEFTHMISIQKEIKFSTTFPYGFFQLFGYEKERRKDVVRGFPNTLISYPISSINIPVWFAEGVAQHQANGARFDYRDPHREMIIRDRIITGKFLTFSEMGVFGKTSHGNESSYNQGFAFVNYLCSRFGEDVLRKIAEANSKLSTFTFDGALRSATGVEADSLYEQWKRSLQHEYKRQLSTIAHNEVSGDAIESEGFANLYPAWSPDATRLAWVSNKNSDWFGGSNLVVRDMAGGESKIVSSRVASSLSWSPDGKYIAFSKRMAAYPNYSMYNELFIVDPKKEEEIRLTEGLRGKNPDWDSSGKRLVFVTETNGLTQLNVLTLEGDPQKDVWNTFYFDIETGRLLDSPNEQSRVVKVRNGRLTQLLAFQDNRQIYHPRWSPDDSYIVFDTAVEYGRNIGKYDLNSSKFELILKDRTELRYPDFNPQTGNLIFSSAKTGIYNIYEQDKKSKEWQLLTNVQGGAMMGSLNSAGALAFAHYGNVGYHLNKIDRPQPLDQAKAKYIENYGQQVPEKNFDDSEPVTAEDRPYTQQFTGLHILPRLLIDYKTVKPGFYLFSGDVLNQMNFVAGASANFDLDYNLYGRFEYKTLFPTLFIDAINLSENITDTLRIRRGENVYQNIDRDVNFDLTEVSAGISFHYPNWLHWQLSYAISLYHAKLEWRDPFSNQIANFRYRYLDGRAIRFGMVADLLKKDKNYEINPTGGRYLTFHYNYEENDFLVNFDTGKNIGIEQFKRYNYHHFELDWEEFFENPLIADHGIGLHLRSGYIDRPVDDFFNLFAGGLIGMKGYSYFSIEGTKKLIGSITYRFPLWQHMDMQVFNIYFNKLYFGVFYDYGNAWNADEIDLSSFKKDIGFQLRLETFSNYLFPTRLFAEAVYPLDEVRNQQTVYKKDWRFYFGVLFDFDLRERLSGRSNRPLIRWKGSVN